MTNEYIDRNRQQLESSDAYISDILFGIRPNEDWDLLKNALANKKHGFDL